MKKSLLQQNITFKIDAENKKKLIDYKAMIKRKYGSLNQFYIEALNQEFAKMIDSPYDSTLNLMHTSKITDQTYNLVKKLIKSVNELKENTNESISTLWKKIDHIIMNNAEQQSINKSQSQINDEPIRQETIDYINEMKAEIAKDDENQE